MKRIYFTLTILFLVISGMAYLYFSRLNSVAGNKDSALEIATQNAAILYRVENDARILDILDGQDLFFKLIGKEKAGLLKAVRQTFLSNPAMAAALEHKTIYISILPGNKHTIDFLICTQLTKTEQHLLITSINKKKVNENTLYTKISAQDGTFFVNIDKGVLLISNSSEALKVMPVIEWKEDNPFVNFILSNDKLTKNSLANVYINYNILPELLKSVTPNINKEEFEVLRGLNAYTHLSYNFSKTNIFFSGETTLKNDSGYLGLFLNTIPQKLHITGLLPQHTASYALYNVGNYSKWLVRFRDWFSKQKGNTNIAEQVQSQHAKYHIQLDDTFPKYTDNQFMTFQLRQGQKLGAVSLINGDKLNQLLLDLSNDIDGTVRQFKEDNILFYYFGTPFKKFRRPFFVIKDNYLICANYASNLQDFIRDYQDNRLLVNQPEYTALFNQLPNTTSILYYLNTNEGAPTINNLIYPSFRNHVNSDNGLENFGAFVFQISANKESFQTNLLIPSKLPTLSKDTL